MTQTNAPRGYAMVPSEPTYQMAEAMGVKWESGEGFPWRYRAMLAVAPQPDPQEVARTEHPMRVAGRDFPAGSLVAQVLGRAQAHYDAHQSRLAKDGEKEDLDVPHWSDGPTTPEPTELLDSPGKDAKNPLRYDGDSTSYEQLLHPRF